MTGPGLLKAWKIGDPLRPKMFLSLLALSEYVFSGVRPSSGADTLENDTAWEISDWLERAEVAAAEDGRTPVNRYLSEESAGVRAGISLHFPPTKRPKACVAQVS